MKYTKSDLVKAKKFKDHSLIMTDSYNHTLSGSYSMRYQSRFYTNSILDLFLLNYKVNNNQPDFANSISNFSGEYAQSSLKTVVLEEIQDGTQIDLPANSKLKGSLEGSLNNRKSTRNFSKEFIKMKDLSSLLFHSLSVSDKSSHGRYYPRKYASGGGLYPVYLYFYAKNIENLESGFYRYQPYSHSLAQISNICPDLDILSNVSGIDVDNTSLMGFWVFDKRKTLLKYGDMSLALALIEIGQAMQNLYLTGYYYGLGFCELGGFNKKICEKYLQLDGIDCHVLDCFVSGYSI